MNKCIIDGKEFALVPLSKRESGEIVLSLSDFCDGEEVFSILENLSEKKGIPVSSLVYAMIIEFLQIKIKETNGNS